MPPSVQQFTLRVLVSSDLKVRLTEATTIRRMDYDKYNNSINALILRPHWNKTIPNEKIQGKRWFGE